MLACNDDALSGQCGLESEITVPGLTASSIYLIRIGSFPGKPGGTGQFDIEAFMPPDVPRNDDCIDAEVLPDCGSYAYDNLLATEDGLSDATCLELGSPKIIRDVWYSFTPQSSGTHFFSTCGGTVLDTKIAVYRDTGVCPPTEIIDCDDDVECIIQVGPSIVSWTAIAGTAYLLRLGSSPGADGGIGAFDMLGCGPPVIGTSYCTSTPNSTGFPATIEATGSSSVSANDLVLTANAVPNAPGIGLFLAGPAPGQAPLFDGVLCLDFSGLQRINQVSPVVNNTVTQAIDYTGVSTGTVPLNVMAGQSYFYQYWFRDPMVLGTNLTDGISICFTP